MKQNWLAKNIVTNIVVLVVFLLLGTENVPAIPSLVTGYLVSMVIGNQVFPLPDELKHKVEAHWQQEDPSMFTVGVVMLMLSTIHAVVVYVCWQWLVSADVDNNTAFVWIILIYNAVCTLVDRHAMKLVEEELRY
jgi:xanthosine utilization system XapX-like protein